MAGPTRPMLGSAGNPPRHDHVDPFRPSLHALIGGVVGAAAAALAILLVATTTTGEEGAFVVIPVLAIAVCGLILGSGAALYAFLVGGLVLVGSSALLVSGETLETAEILRLAAFVLGSPLLVVLVHRAEESQAIAERARDVAESARSATEEERRSLADARHDVDAALSQAERERARLEEVAEAIPEPLIVYDDALRGTYGNRAALRLFGRSFVERPIEEWGHLAQPRDERGIGLPADQWPQALAQRSSVRRRMTLRIPMSGRDVMVDVEGTPIPAGGCVLLLRDVGKEEDERRRLSRFASFVAHELRNPLAVAKARIELAQRDPDLPDKAANHAWRALESVDAAIGILERLELYSRADAGRLETRRERFPLLPALGAAIERLRARGCEREVDLAIEDGPLEVEGDRHLAEQAITNLLTNADRYSTPQAPIRVEVRGGNPVTLRVIDAGPGVADDVAERLFRDRVTAGRGLGLGLYLVHATMSAMGGSVQLEERRPSAVFALRWQAHGGPVDAAS
jgi:signal transduction histidine kinase